eukprot:6214636-Pleurochrysis_carterae.AAC.1
MGAAVRPLSALLSVSALVGGAAELQGPGQPEPWCAADALAILPTLGGCPSSDWAEVIANALPRAQPVTLVNVGANKGYKAAEFLRLWSQFNVSALSWRNSVRGFARERKFKFLLAFACGNCNDCRAQPPARHGRTGAHLHLLELLQTTRDLLHTLVSEMGLQSAVEVHNMAASDKTGTMRIKKFFAGDERATAVCRSKCTDEVNVTTLDDFFRIHDLRDVYQVTIDTEGHDAQVLEGMGGILSQREVYLLEFEVQPKVGLDLRRVLTRLASFGYECFWQYPKDLVPASRDCWRDEYQHSLRWSNMVCAHAAEALKVLYDLSHAGYERRQTEPPMQVAAHAKRKG